MKFAELYSKTFLAFGMEVVFVSSDQDEESFNAYYDEMPWAALPYANRTAHGALHVKYGVRGIPTLVFIDVDGNVLTTEGINAVNRHARGENLFFMPIPLASISVTDDGPAHAQKNDIRQRSEGSHEMRIPVVLGSVRAASTVAKRMAHRRSHRMLRRLFLMFLLVLLVLMCMRMCLPRSKASCCAWPAMWPQVLHSAKVS
jgi:hypothetical protein